MGVCFVFETDKPAKAIERSVEAGGAELIGLYVVDSTPFRPKESTAISRMFLIHHSKFPQTSFTIAPGPDPSKGGSRAVCDRGMDLILAKLSAGLQQDLAGRFEVNGNEYRLKDFIVRVGTATMGVASKGVIVEIDYTPTWVPVQAHGMLNDFVQIFFPNEPIGKENSLRNLPDVYTSMDTAMQYLRIFQTMRKKT